MFRRLPKLAKYNHILNYSLSVFVTLMSNFIIALLFMRFFSASGYASFALIKIALTVIVGIADLGIAQAVVNHVNTGKDANKTLSNIFSSMLIMAFPATLLLIFVLHAANQKINLHINFSLIITILILVTVQLLATELLNWERANHRSKSYTNYTLVRTALQLAFVLGITFFVRNVQSYIIGLCFAESLFFLYWWINTTDKQLIKIKYFSFRFIGNMVKYGWPHAFVISNCFLLANIDRYLLAFLQPDKTVVAHYDACYLLISSSLSLVVRPFNLFIFPAYMKEFSDKGTQAAASLVNKSINQFLIGGSILAIFVVALRKPLILLLYPDSYIAAQAIFAPLAVGVLMNGIFIGIVSGAYISKKTWIIGICVTFSMLINVLVNYLLVPKFLAQGAAYATTIAYFCQMYLGYVFSKRSLPVKLPLILLLASSGVLFFVQWLT